MRNIENTQMEKVEVIQEHYQRIPKMLLTET